MPELPLEPLLLDDELELLLLDDELELLDDALEPVLLDDDELELLLDDELELLLDDDELELLLDDEEELEELALDALLPLEPLLLVAEEPELPDGEDPCDAPQPASSAARMTIQIRLMSSLEMDRAR